VRARARERESERVSEKKIGRKRRQTDRESVCERESRRERDLPGSAGMSKPAEPIEQGT
jgi:hypothetical protein